MGKKAEKKGDEIPAWVVTFGDMMSLLLCFFILLQIFSELKKDHEYQRVVTAVQQAFGYSGGIGVMPVDDIPLRSMIEKLEAMASGADAARSDTSRADDPGVRGVELRVSKVREGIVFTLGGPSTFLPFSAEITPAARGQLEDLAVLLAGRNNKIAIRGHAAAKYLPADSQWKSLDELSWARASAVRAVLVSEGLEDRLLRMEVVGTREPAIARPLDPNDEAENRRVEVVLTEQLVEDVHDDANYTNPNLAMGH